MSHSSARQSRLDLLRLLAMGAVFTYHLDGALPERTFVARLGDVGIVLFVMLSGYGLAHSQRDRPVSLKSFLTRKAWRILPSYWLSLALIGVGLRALTNKRPTAIDWALHVTGMHALWPASPYAATVAANLWFLSLILCLYAVFPWLHRRLWRAPLAWGLGALVASHAALWAVAQHVPGASFLLHYRGLHYVSPFFAFNVLPFGLGVLLAKVSSTGARWPMLFASLAVSAYYAALGLTDVALGVALFGAVMVSPELPSPAGRALARVTASSYEFYLLHHVLMGPVYRHWMLQTHAAPRWLFALVYAVSLVALSGVVQRASSFLTSAVGQLFTRDHAPTLRAHHSAS